MSERRSHFFQKPILLFHHTFVVNNSNQALQEALQGSLQGRGTSVTTFYPSSIPRGKGIGGRIVEACGGNFTPSPRAGQGRLHATAVKDGGRIILGHGQLLTPLAVISNGPGQGGDSSAFFDDALLGRGSDDHRPCLRQDLVQEQGCPLRVDCAPFVDADFAPALPILQAQETGVGVGAVGPKDIHLAEAIGIAPLAGLRVVKVIKWCVADKLGADQRGRWRVDWCGGRCRWCGRRVVFRGRRRPVAALDHERQVETGRCGRAISLDIAGGE